MAGSEELATQLARCVEMFRDASAKDEQKAAFRALLELVQQTGLYLREDERGVRVNGEAVHAAALGALTHRLALHNVSQIQVPPTSPPAEVFALLRALAEPPTPAGEDIPSRLETVGARQVRVAVGPPPPESPGAPWPSPAPAASPSLGTEGLLRGEPMKDIASATRDVTGASHVTYDPDPPPPDQALPAVGSAPAAEVVLGGPPPPREPARPPASAPAPDGGGTEPRPEEPRRAAPPVEIPRGTGSGFVPDLSEGERSGPQRRLSRAELLAGLQRQPSGPQVGDLLAALGPLVADAVRGQQFEEALTILASLVEVEQRVPDTARRQYGIALRRMYSKALLQGVAGLLDMPGHQAAAAAVLQRAGPDGVEVLLERLTTSQTIAERRAIFDALRHMPEGRSQLIHLLGHPKWFVVRNAAELIGELGAEEAVPSLGKLLSHEDERVRKAVALALAKIGTRAAGEPLRRALRDPSPEVRLQVAIGVGGQRSHGLAMPLVVALDEEKEEAVQRELILALGRIGSPDAVQALIKLAQPAGRVFGRKPVALRLAAVDALRLAATPAALGMLEGLAGDSDRQVAAAVQGALTELKRRQK